MQWGCNTEGLSCNKMFGATCFALLVEEILGGTLKMFDASCFALLVEEILEMVRGSCGGKATVLFVFRGAP